MVRVSGHAGSVRAGYQVALELGPWDLVLLPELPRRYRLQASVRAVDEHWLAQEPLAVALEIGRDIWRWELIDPALDGRQVTVILRGVPEILHGAVAIREKERVI